jgi:hypothetical protein
LYSVSSNRIFSILLITVSCFQGTSFALIRLVLSAAALTPAAVRNVASGNPPESTQFHDTRCQRKDFAFKTGAKI